MSDDVRLARLLAATRDERDALAAVLETTREALTHIRALDRQRDCDTNFRYEQRVRSLAHNALNASRLSAQLAEDANPGAVPPTTEGAADDAS